MTATFRLRVIAMAIMEAARGTVRREAGRGEALRLRRELCPASIAAQFVV